MFNVLLATDAPWVEASVMAALPPPEFDVEVATDSARVVAAAKASDRDLIILDLQSGNRGGIAVSADLETDVDDALAAVPVLVLLDRNADEWLAKRFGIDAWLVKPVSPARLAAVVRDLLDKAVSPVRAAP